jgi:acyl dehydratase
LGDELGLTGCGAGEEGDELVAAEAAEQVPVVDDRAEAGGDLGEDEVAGEVAVAVVDGVVARAAAVFASSAAPRTAVRQATSSGSGVVIDAAGPGVLTSGVMPRPPGPRTMIRVAHVTNVLRTLAGHDLGHSAWLRVDQDRVNRFADATDDKQWIHINVARDTTGPFGAPVAHGYLPLSLLAPLWAQVLRVEGVGMGVNYGPDRFRFPAPVTAGSRIRLAAVLAEVRDIVGGVETAVDCTVEVEGSVEPALVARALYRYYD